jgi:hypothetical protein
MNKLLLLILFVHLCFFKVIYIGDNDITTPISLDQLKCIYQAGYFDEVFVFYKQLSNGSWVNRANITQIKETFGIDSHIVLQPYLFSRNPVEISAITYAQFLNNLPIKMVWYYPAEKSPENIIPCDYAFNFSLSLAKKIKIPLGIAS